MTEILTPRLVLRTPRAETAAEIQQAKAAVWPELQKWMSWAYDDQLDIEATRRSIARATAKSPFEFLHGFCRETDAFVVAGGLSACDAPDTYATGYWIAKEFLGKGYATEATNAMLRYAFGALKAKAVILNYHEGNEKSRKVIEKLGFKPTHVEHKRHKRCSDGVMVDTHHFARRDAEGLPALEVTWR